MCRYVLHVCTPQVFSYLTALIILSSPFLLLVLILALPLLFFPLSPLLSSLTHIDPTYVKNALEQVPRVGTVDVVIQEDIDGMPRVCGHLFPLLTEFTLLDHPGQVRTHVYAL